MELASQLSIISVGIGIVLIISAFVRHFRQRSRAQKQHPGESPDDDQ